MKSFEERKSEYLNKLMSNQEIVLSMRGNTPPANMMAILNPSNEMELTIAETSFALISDIFNLFMNYDDEPNIEENQIINMYIEIINRLKNNEKFDYKMFEKHDTVKIAKSMYDTILLSRIDPDEVAKYVSSKCGFNIDDFISMQVFETYMNQAFEMVKENSTTNPSPKDLADMTDEDIDLLIGYASEFHKLCEAGMNIETDDKTIGTK